jgi:hypothetical protein
MNTILNCISVAAAFFFGIGVVYITLDVTLGRLKIFHSKFEWYGLQVKDYAFIAFGAFVLLTFVSFVLPY